MQNWTAVFVAIALLAAVFGFGGLAGAAAGAAKLAFVVAIGLAFVLEANFGNPRRGG